MDATRVEPDGVLPSLLSGQASATAWDICNKCQHPLTVVAKSPRHIRVHKKVKYINDSIPQLNVFPCYGKGCCWVKLDLKKKLSGLIQVDYKTWMWKIQVDLQKLKLYSKTSDVRFLGGDLASLSEIYTVSEINTVFSDHVGVATIFDDIASFPHDQILEKGISSIIAYPLVFKGNFLVKYLEERSAGKFKYARAKLEVYDKDQDREIGIIYAMFNENEELVGFTTPPDSFLLNI